MARKSTKPTSGKKREGVALISTNVKEVDLEIEEMEDGAFTRALNNPLRIHTDPASIKAAKKAQRAAEKPSKEKPPKLTKEVVAKAKSQTNDILDEMFKLDRGEFIQRYTHDFDKAKAALTRLTSLNLAWQGAIVSLQADMQLEQELKGVVIDRRQMQRVMTFKNWMLLCEALDIPYQEFIEFHLRSAEGRPS